MNFNPGPAALPLPVLERARDELIDFAGTGMSIMEHSHRGAAYEGVHNEAISLLRQLMGIPDGYEVLFLQGGASQQFAQVPMNLLSEGRSADYVLTGHWGERALADAEAAAALGGGGVRVAASTASGAGKSATFTRVLRAGEINADTHAAYLHVTSNETIHGVQFTEFPDPGGVPLVCDMSSDVLSRRVDVSRFAMIYAGAQKNIGPSGVVVIVARKELVEAGRKDIPAIFQYRTYAANNSLYNTPPTFAIYLVRGVLQWVKESGGLEQVERWNREKADLIYGAIDRHAQVYNCPVERDSRSWMNVVFRLPSPEQESRFVKEAEQQGMIGLKGHRSVGGIRVSLYNAVPVEWARTLAGFMDDFARRAG
ncbi:MAG: Phosphoserine aminotransferase [uncultured Chloroflexi bacterium]|uniref:Phosphoserine aminotransferase n=1 Tax=uncultured Chloroflexota bacterium TaxID=166587 RepID=A0A6J4HLA3_9CHLR|nr:MAG: Phosphoserine aminotransferase [uncultured Chloroflexota bacterium]